MALTVTDIVLYVSPALLVVLAIKIVNDYHLKKENILSKENARGSYEKHLLPLKITAHERSILFLERIRPENLVLRLGSTGISAKTFQVGLLQEIRDEYEHNIVQQLYLSNESWASLIQAKETIITLVNRCSSELSENADGMDLARLILQAWATTGDDVLSNAIKTSKKDINEVFN